MSKTRIALLLICFGLIVIGGEYKSRRERRISDEYFKKLNLNLSGIVTNVNTVVSGHGIIYVDIRQSSLKEYNGRLEDYYYCIIRDGKAEILEGTDQIGIGDSIVVDTNNNKFQSFKKGNLVVNRHLQLTQFNPVGNEVKKYHRL